MTAKEFSKYTPYPSISGLTDRTWPDNRIESAPIWCAVDLRDGNQALVNPMNHQRKTDMYNLLLAIGIKEIEIGFPSSSQIEFDFARHIIENDLIPEDVTPQVLVPSRSHLIERTFEAMSGAKQAIIHLYNSTSIAQRRDVFKMSPQEIADLACTGTRQIKQLANDNPQTNWRFQYSPESFTGTEPEIALEICNAVIETWEPTPENKMIINLPSTVEMSTPNLYADLIEWMSRNLVKRESVIISLHTHNDRGTGIAATELGLMAGADRVEGTLLGNGERTGNVDLVTLALNMFTQGVDPKLDMSDLPKIVETVEYCNQIETHPRHPYAGELVFTALSGSHQDAIKKGLEAHKENRRNYWDIPYLPIDPNDIGRTYETAIRINSQSGKSGIAYVLEQEIGLKLPKLMQIEFAGIVQKTADETAEEISAKQVADLFDREYINQDKGYKLEHIKFDGAFNGEDDVICDAVITDRLGDQIKFSSKGNGPINAFAEGFREKTGISFTLTSYEEHALSSGSDAKAASYISIKDDQGNEKFGAGIDPNTAKASIKALLSACSRI